MAGVIGLGIAWLTANLTAPAALLAIPVTVVDVLLLLAFAWTWPLLCELVSLYDPALEPGSRHEAIRAAYAGLLASVIGAALLPLSESLHVVSLIVFGPASTVSLLTTRALLRAWFSRARQRRRHRVVIAGSGPRAQEILEELQAHPELGIDVLGFFDETGHPFASTTGLPHLGAVDVAERVLMGLDADEVIVTLPLKSHFAEAQQLMTACERTGTEARYFTDLFRHSTGTVRSERGAVSLKTFPDDSRRVVKRALDVIVAGTALVVLAPLMLLIVLLVRLDSPGPVLFMQDRVGLHRHHIRVWKFRTMAHDAEARQRELEGRNEADGPLFKMRDDPRVTGVGRFLRRSSLDELPQLFNVLTGAMSLVGPRPLPLRDVSRFDQPWLMRRFSAPPGVTGLWQVRGRSATTFDEFVLLDLQYIDHWSLGLDLRILIETIPAVLRGHGAM